MLLGACAWQASAQPAFDSSGDGQLNGAYYMRQVFYFVSDDAGDLGEAMNVQGEITFNGAGGYTFTGSLLDSASGSSTPVAVNAATGTYVVSGQRRGLYQRGQSGFSGRSDYRIGIARRFHWQQHGEWQWL